MTCKKEIEEFIRKNNILKIGKVTLKSGVVSDHFYNFGGICQSDQISSLGRWMADLIGDFDFDAIFTSAYKGIVICTAVILEIGFRFPEKSFKMGYTRKETKTHGEGGLVVGYEPKKGDRVVLLDDVVTSGGSYLEMFQYLTQFEAVPVLAVAAVSRMNQKASVDLSSKTGPVPFRCLVEDCV